MNKNVGSTDKIIRLLISAGAIGAYFMGYLASPWDLVGLGVAGIMLATSFLNFCPIYSIFGLKSNK